MAGTTGLEPATSAVTGQRSNQTELRPLQFQPLSLNCRIYFSSHCPSFARFNRFHRIEQDSAGNDQYARTQTPDHWNATRTTKLSRLRYENCTKQIPAIRNWNALVYGGGRITEFAAFTRASLGFGRIGDAARGIQNESWLPPRDSNPDMLIQSQLSCH